jgi:Tol biopolymer transport system component
VAFQSNASNLVADDTNLLDDIFVYDRQSDSIERVSVDGSGNQGNNSSMYPSINSDGRYVAFVSAASNLVAADTNDVVDIFVVLFQ